MLDREQQIINPGLSAHAPAGVGDVLNQWVSGRVSNGTECPIKDSDETKTLARPVFNMPPGEQEGTRLCFRCAMGTDRCHLHLDYPMYC